MIRLAAVMLGFSGILVAQSQFVEVFGGTSDDRGHCIIQTSDGNFVIAGGLQSFGPGYLMFFLSKFDASGNRLWSTALDVSPTDREYAISVIQTSDGGFAASGRTYISYYDMLLVRYNSSGTPLWVRRLVLGDYEYGYSLIETADGGIVVGDRTASASANALLTKFDASGNWLWPRRIGGSNDEGIQCLIKTSDGGYAAAGWASSYGAGDYDMFLLRFDASWNILWAKTIGTSGYEFGFSLIQTQDKGFAIVGQTDGMGAGSRDILLTRFDSLGNHIWTRTVGGPGNDDMGGSLSTLYGGRNLIVQDADGGLVFVGTTESYGLGNGDIFLNKFDLNGNRVWSRVLGGASYDYGYGLTRTQDGGFAVTGMTQSYGYGSWDIVFAKFDGSGNTCMGSSVTPTVTSPTPTITSPSLTPVSVTPTIYTPSYTLYTPAPYDTMLCYVPVQVGEEPLEPGQGLCLTASGNTVRFTLPDAADVRLSVYDPAGRFVARPVEGRLEAGEHELVLSIGTGVYFVELVAGTAHEQTKVVVR